MPTHCRGVCIFTASIMFTEDIAHHYQGKKAAQPKVQKAEHTNPTSPTDHLVTPLPHHCTIPRTYRDCPQRCLSHWWTIPPRVPIVYTLQSWAIPTSLWSTIVMFWDYLYAYLMQTYLDCLIHFHLDPFIMYDFLSLYNTISTPPSTAMLVDSYWLCLVILTTFDNMEKYLNCTSRILRP